PVFTWVVVVGLASPAWFALGRGALPGVRGGRSMGCGTGEERPVTEWDARAYNRVSALQQWVAEKSLGRLPLEGDERVLDLGCGDGKITIEIVRRLPRGSVVGVDASHAMIAFAARKFPPTAYPNLAFLVADASQLPFADQLALVVSVIGLHGVRDQAAALRSIRGALVATGRPHPRFVSRGERKALEDVIEDPRRAPQWSAYFTDYSPP